VEFAVITSILVPIFAAAFTLGMSLSKALQVSNVCRDAVVLMVRAATDPKAGLDLATTQNQRIIVRAASGLQMSLNPQYDPDPNGKGLAVLSKVILVGDNECAAGVLPPPANAPPWNAGNCPNYNSYVFGYRVYIGNKSTFSSSLGDPPAGAIQSDGTLSASDIATNAANRAQKFGPGGIITLNQSTFALVAEMFADISTINLFSIFKAPVLYSRSIS